MISPNMATMLAYVTVGAAVAAEDLQEMTAARRRRLVQPHQR